MDRFPSSDSWNAATEAKPSENGHSPAQSRVTAPSLQTGPRTHRNFFVPLHYTPTYNYPLLVWLHNEGYHEGQIDDVMPYISLRNYVGVGVRAAHAIDSAGHRFGWRQSAVGIDAAHHAIAAAIDDAKERFSIHSDRIVLAGYQDGGTMAMRIAFRDPTRFAAVVSVAGRMPQGRIRNVSELRERRLPMLWQWGNGNPSYIPDQLKDDFRQLLALGGGVEVRQYPGDDEMDTVVLRDIDQWVMQHVVQGSAMADNQRWATSPTAYSAN